MAKYGFWNSKKYSNGVGDRLYDAEDLSFFYSLFFNSGLACTMDELDSEDMFLVTLTKGSYSIKINQGTAIIDGKWYNGIGEKAEYISMNTGHTVSSGLSRIDAVCIKKDDVNRKFTFYVKEGVEATSPVPPTIDKNVELCLAYYTVNSSYSVNYDSLVDTRKDHNFAGCASLKMRERETAVDEHLNKINYICTGVNDNIKLTRLVQEYYALEKNKDLEINVIGTMGISQFAGGDGSASDPLHIFCFGKYLNYETGENSTTNKNNVRINFSNCSPIKVTTNNIGNTAAGYQVVLFAGNENIIENAKVVFDVNGSIVKLFYGYDHKIKNSYLKVASNRGTGDAIGVDGTGTIENCDIIAIAASGTAYGLTPLTNSVETFRILNVVGCNILAQNLASSSYEACGLYVRPSKTYSVLRALRNTIFGATDSSAKTTKTYKINSGRFIITDNIVKSDGAVYSTTNGVNANNIIIDTLAGFDIEKYD